MPFIKHLATSVLVTSHVYRLLVTTVLIASLIRKVVRRG